MTTVITGSSAFTSATFDETAQTLTVQYKSGTYIYSGVSATEIQSIETASSKGRQLRNVVATKKFVRA